MSHWVSHSPAKSSDSCGTFNVLAEDWRSSNVDYPTDHQLTAQVPVHDLLSVFCWWRTSDLWSKSKQQIQIIGCHMSRATHHTCDIASCSLFMSYASSSRQRCNAMVAVSFNHGVLPLLLCAYVCSAQAAPSSSSDEDDAPRRTRAVRDKSKGFSRK